MADFDIHRLDGLDPASSRAEGELQRYQDALLQGFCSSPEAADLPTAPSEIGYWAARMIQFCFNYLGATVPGMSVADAEEILKELFPRKVSLSSPDEADSVIPELSAFWRYLGREHRLPNAPAILKLLRDLQPQFKAMMNDPSKFGMAKSFFMMGQSAGFDMSDEQQLQSFAAQYNAGLAAEHAAQSQGQAAAPHSDSRRTQRKRIRKLSGQARRKNRRKGR
jgi:hypothetical protein